MRPVSVGETVLEVEVRGTGDPVVMIQTALVADELLALAGQPAIGDHFQIVVYHRRGYGGSDPRPGLDRSNATRTTVDALLAALGIGRAHVVGLS